MEPAKDASEQSALLNNSNTEKSHTLDKVIFGVGLLSGIGVTIYKAIELASETPTWLLLGTSISLIVVTTFGVVRARSANPERESILASARINTSNSNSASELKQISEKIYALSILIPLPNEDEYSVVQIQNDYSYAHVLQQLSIFEEYLNSQKEQKKSNGLASGNSDSIIKASETLLEKTTALQQQLEQAQKESLSKNDEIANLSQENGKLLQKIEGLQSQLNDEIKNLSQVKGELLKEKEELQEQLEKAQEELHIKNEENEDLSNEIASNKLQWIVAQQTLGSPDQIVSNDNLDKIRQHITNLLATPSKSRNNSAYSSLQNSAYSTPSKF